jgi:glutathione S-transferase
LTPRVYRIPFSTNVERVALALAHKGLTVEWIDVDPRDRGPVRAVSGQDLVPVLVDDGLVVSDSTAILRHLEERQPEPRLYPLVPARRAEIEVFVEWFNRVWKVAPNALESGGPDEELSRELRGSRDVFEALLDGRDYLFGDGLTVADLVAFPFLKYGLLRDPADDEPFHRILVDHLRLDGAYPRLEAWIRRMDALPRA